MMAIPPSWGPPSIYRNRKRRKNSGRSSNQNSVSPRKWRPSVRWPEGSPHDFNNILTAILGYSELTYGLLSGNKRERRYIGEVITGCERAKDLINQILTFSRRTDHTLQPVSITPVIKETVRLLRASLPSTIQIRTNTKVAHDTVLGDPTQIHQVLMNLGTNAAYAMHEGGGELTIELVAHPAAGGNSAMDASSGGTCHLELIVRDTGQGISADIMDRIFDPFFTTKEVGKGTGMGLSVVHGIVEAHGGKIAVESSSGKGTTFRVFIPLISSSSEHATKHEQPKTLPPGHECILWVDDEKALADLGQDMLTHLGYEVVSTTNSPEAVATLQSRTGALRSGHHGYDDAVHDGDRACREAQGNPKRHSHRPFAPASAQQKWPRR